MQAIFHPLLKVSRKKITVKVLFKEEKKIMKNLNHTKIAISMFSYDYFKTSHSRINL